MSTYRSIRNIRRSIGTVVLALLGGLLIVLQFVLPAVAFAAPARFAPNPSSTDPAFARAQVSVVRLIVTYNTPSPPQSHKVRPSSPPACASWYAAGSLLVKI